MNSDRVTHYYCPACQQKGSLRLTPGNPVDQRLKEKGYLTCMGEGTPAQGCRHHFRASWWDNPDNTETAEFGTTVAI